MDFELVDYEPTELKEMLKEIQPMPKRVIHDITKNRIIFSNNMYLTHDTRKYLMNVFYTNPNPNDDEVLELCYYVHGKGEMMSFKQMKVFFKNKRHYARKKKVNVSKCK